MTSVCSMHINSVHVTSDDKVCYNGMEDEPPSLTREGDSVVEDEEDGAPLLPPCLEPHAKSPLRALGLERSVSETNAGDDPCPFTLSPQHSTNSVASDAHGGDTNTNQDHFFSFAVQTQVSTPSDNHSKTDKEKKRRSKRKPVPVRSRSPSDPSPPDKKPRVARPRKTIKQELNGEVPDQIDTSSNVNGVLELEEVTDANCMTSCKGSVSPKSSVGSSKNWSTGSEIKTSPKDISASTNPKTRSITKQCRTYKRSKSKRKTGCGDGGDPDYGSIIRTSLLTPGIQAEHMRDIIRSTVLTPSDLCAVRNYSTVYNDTGAVSPCWQQVVNNMILRVKPYHNNYDVREWDIDMVSEFVGSVLKEPMIMHKLVEDEIDGEAMLLLTLDDLTNRLALKLGPALKLYHTILAIKHTIE